MISANLETAHRLEDDLLVRIAGSTFKTKLRSMGRETWRGFRMRKTTENSRENNRLRPMSEAQLRQIAGGSNVCAVIQEVCADVQKIEAAIKAAL
jgi:hypothetical protein